MISKYLIRCSNTKPANSIAQRTVISPLISELIERKLVANHCDTLFTDQGIFVGSYFIVSFFGVIIGKKNNILSCLN